MTVEIIAAMKTLEIAVVLNNSSTEGVVQMDVLVKERDSVAAKVTKMEADLAGSKIVVEDRDCRIASLEKKAADEPT